VADEIDHTMFLGKAPRPDVGAEVPKRFRLADTREWVRHNRLHEIEHLEGYTTIDRHPVPQILAELVLKNAVPISSGCDDEPPSQGQIHAG
jgi:hypothetical protein